MPRLSDIALGVASVAVAAGGVALLWTVRATAGSDEIAVSEPAAEPAARAAPADRPERPAGKPGGPAAGARPTKAARPPLSHAPAAATSIEAPAPLKPQGLFRGPGYAPKAAEARSRLIEKYQATDPIEAVVPELRGQKLLEKAQMRKAVATAFGKEKHAEDGVKEAAKVDPGDTALVHRRLASEERRARALARRIRSSERRGDADPETIGRERQTLDRLRDSIDRRREELGLPAFSLPD